LRVGLGEQTTTLHEYKLNPEDFLKFINRISTGVLEMVSTFIEIE